MKCRICGNVPGNQTYQIKEMMFGLRDTFTYFQCNQCKCLQIETIPADLSKYYPSDYYSLQPIKAKHFSGLKWRLKRKRHAATLIPQTFPNKLLGSVLPTKEYDLLARIPLSSHSRILDVGCGIGDYLYPLREAGFTGLLGIDPYIAESIKYANGLRIEKKDIYQVNGSWDIIMYHHAFEHVPDPLESLQAVAHLLTAGGTCLIRIPTVSSFAWEHYRTHWFQLDAPRHLFLHSVESMQLLAKKAGLVLTEVIYDSNHNQFMMSEQYQKDIPYTMSESRSLTEKMRFKLQKRIYKRKAEQLNREKRGDQAAFFLNKKQVHKK
jgi:2-polyprenyl-3-methyl-5-hydroxy-6-metoxy-1,4-benzoquinol methylase